MQDAFDELSKYGIQWRVEHAPVDYEKAVRFMEERAAAIRDHQAPQLIWLVEHPPLYTAGTSADETEFTGQIDLPVFRTGRGGRHTYHGPGQRIAYVMLDLKTLGSDVRRFVWMLEEWVIETLRRFGLEAERREGRVGVWVPCRGSEAKIAAIGVRLRRWVSFHGLSINVDPNLGHFDGIVPCGISEYGVTSLADLGIRADMSEVDRALLECFLEVFRPQPASMEDVTA